jgi:hypothetical protein
MKAFNVFCAPHSGAAIERVFVRSGHWTSPFKRWLSSSRLESRRFRPEDRRMGRGLAILTSLAMMVATSQAAANVRLASKRHHADPAAKVETISQQRTTSGPKATVKRDISATSDFRAEDLIPDICKGCSS